MYYKMIPQEVMDSFYDSRIYRRSHVIEGYSNVDDNNVEAEAWIDYTHKQYVIVCCDDNGYRPPLVTDIIPARWANCSGDLMPYVMDWSDKELLEGIEASVVQQFVNIFDLYGQDVLLTYSNFSSKNQ